MKQLTYVSGDFSTIKNELIAHVQSTFPEWTDFNDSNTGMALLDLFALVGDMLLYYQNFQVNEAFLPTAQLRHNVINICKKLDYRLSSATAATVPVVFSISSAKDTDINIPKYVAVKTDEVDAVRFEVLGTGNKIAAGDTSTTITCTEGQTIFDELVGVSDGSVTQVFTLSESPVIDETVVVNVESDPTTWTEVENFIDSTSVSKHFMTRLNSNNQTQIVFGDGVNGSIPPSGKNVTATSYRVGGGSEPNRIAINKITVLETTLYDGNGASVSVNVTNSASPNGGEDEETLNHAKMYAPREVKARNASISKEDFETNCEQYPGVARALAQTINDDNTIPLNTEYVYIVPSGGGTASSDLRNAIKTYLQEEKPYATTMRLEVLAAQYITLNVSVNVKVKPRYDNVIDKATIQAAVADAISDHFQYDAVDGDYEFTVDWGKDVVLEEISTVGGRAHEGVEYCKVVTPASDVAIAANRILALGTVTVTML